MATDKQAALGEIFDLFDTDKSGKIDAKECKSALKQLYELLEEPADDAKCEKDAADLIKAADSSQDGKIDRAEWFKFFENL